jgi:hypothetical protein
VYVAISLLCDTIAFLTIISTYKTEDFDPATLYLILFSIFVFKNIFFIVALIMESPNDDTGELQHTLQTPITTVRSNTEYIGNNSLDTFETHEIEEYRTPTSNNFSLPKAIPISYTDPFLTLSDEQRVSDLTVVTGLRRISDLTVIDSNYFRFEQDDTIPVATALPTPMPTCSGYFAP